MYSFWPHLKIPPTTFFCWITYVRGYLYFSPNRTNKYRFQRIFGLSKSFSKRTQNEQRRTITNSKCWLQRFSVQNGSANSRGKTNSQRTAKTTYLRRLEHLVRLFGEIWDIPCTYAHTCATMPCVALCCCGSGCLSAEREGGQISPHNVRVTGTLPSPIRAVTVTRLLATFLQNHHR